MSASIVCQVPSGRPKIRWIYQINKDTTELFVENWKLITLVQTTGDWTYMTGTGSQRSTSSCQANREKKSFNYLSK